MRDDYVTPTHKGCSTLFFSLVFSFAFSVCKFIYDAINMLRMLLRTRPFQSVPSLLCRTLELFNLKWHLSSNF